MDKNRQKQEGKKKTVSSELFQKNFGIHPAIYPYLKKYLMSKNNIAGTELDPSIEMMSKNTHGVRTLQTPNKVV